jgi:hypothetical protein
MFIVMLSMGLVLAAILRLFGSEPASTHKPQPPVRKPVFTPHDELYSIHIGPSGTGSAVGRFGRMTPESQTIWARPQESYQA